MIAPSPTLRLFRPRRRLLLKPTFAAPNKSAGEAVAELLAAAVSGDETTLLDFVAEEAAVSIAERTAQRRRREQRREEEQQKGGGGSGGSGGENGGENKDGQQPPLLLTPLTLEDVVRAAQPHELSLDSFAVRSLVLCPRPLRAATAVSALSPAPGKFIARAALSLPSGEEMTLTLQLVEEERAVSHYKSVRTERHWALVSARGEPCSAAATATTTTAATATAAAAGNLTASTSATVRDARHGPEVVLDAFLAALARGDGATVAALTGAKAGAGARALADAVGGSLFAAASNERGEGKDDDEEEEDSRGGGKESVPPWLRGSENDDDESDNSSPSPSPSRRFPRELEPLVALFLSGSSHDLLSVKMLSARQAWGMAGVRPLGDDGSGFILGGGAAAQQPPLPTALAPPAKNEEQRRKQQKQWQDELQRSQHPRAAFIFRLELCAEDGCWEVRDVARVGGGGGGSGGAFSLGG